jgi:hypothetical protein
MPLTTTLNPNNTENSGNNRKNHNGIRTQKSKLAKQEVLISMTVLPMTDNNYYTDLDNTTTDQAMESILDILENQEEGIALVGKLEWMEIWTKQDNPHTLLSNIRDIEQDMIRGATWDSFSQLISRLRRMNKAVTTPCVSASKQSTTLEW